MSFTSSIPQTNRLSLGNDMYNDKLMIKQRLVGRARILDQTVF